MEKLALFGGTPVLDNQIPYGKQYVDEDDVSSVVDALKSDYLTTGPKLEEFERRLCEITGAKYAVAISNGTTALHAACVAAGIGVGDEVIVSSITFAASSNCVLYCGGTPVFADINPKTWNVDPKDILSKITSKTKAIVAVDFTGQAVEIDEIKEICRKHNLIFIEDAAHSLGTRYKGQPIGSLADLTTFSFHPVKTITSAEGGAILTNSKDFYEKMILYRGHGITRNEEILSHVPYNGYNEQVMLGNNYRMTELQAALGSSQLNKLERFKTRRQEIVDRYNSAFSQVPEIIIQEEIPESETSRHLYIIRLNLEMLNTNRNQFYAALNAENVGLQVHYMPVYYHPYYQELGYSKGLCPIAEKLYEEIITIPLYFSMTNDEVDSVIKAVLKVVEYYRESL